MVARLSTAIGRHEAALEARNLALAADGIKRLTEVAKSRVQLEILEKDMATRDFFAYFPALVIPLTCADSSDDRSYALVRGTVWSCARDLEPTQWSIFV